MLAKSLVLHGSSGSGIESSRTVVGSASTVSESWRVRRDDRVLPRGPDRSSSVGETLEEVLIVRNIVSRKYFGLEFTYFWQS